MTYRRTRRGPAPSGTNVVTPPLPTGVGATDSAAIQAAVDALGVVGGTILLPRSATDYNITTPIVIDTNYVHFEGAGQNASSLVAPAGHLFNVDTTALVTGLSFRGLRLEATGGHVFNVTGINGVSQCWWEDVAFVQNSTGFSVWNSVLGNFLDCLMLNCWLIGKVGATVPVWNVISDIGGANCNLFMRLRCNNSGLYVFHIENSEAAASWAYDNEFRNINFENTMGGNIRCLSSNGTLIENCTTYDLDTPTTQHLYVFDKNAASSSSRNNTLRRVNRRGGALGAGLKDIKVVGGDTTRIDECSGTIDLNSTTGNVVRTAPTTVLENAGGSGNIIFDTPNADSTFYGDLFLGGTDVKANRGAAGRWSTRSGAAAGARAWQLTDLADTVEYAYVLAKDASNRVTLALGGVFLVMGGTGSPEGAVTAPAGSLFTSVGGGAGTTLYVKESGAGNTGWVAK